MLEMIWGSLKIGKLSEKVFQNNLKPPVTLKIILKTRIVSIASV